MYFWVKMSYIRLVRNINNVDAYSFIGFFVKVFRIIRGISKVLGCLVQKTWTVLGFYPFVIVVMHLLEPNLLPYV